MTLKRDARIKSLLAQQYCITLFTYKVIGQYFNTFVLSLNFHSQKALTYD